MRRVQNPPNPFLNEELLLDEPRQASLEVYEEQCKEPISKNTSPDVGFRFSLNPYRGCFHACAYCYARPSHQYLGFGAGTDFDRRIVVKANIAERLRATFERPSWRGETIAFSGNTDCYQPLEATYRLTRACLEVCATYRNPVAVITKGVLVRRDLNVLAELAGTTDCRVMISIPFVRDEDARLVEPFASPPSKRFETIRVLRDAGIPVGVGIAPVIPGLNDDQIPAILERAASSGADSAFYVLLRLPSEVLPVFRQRLEESFPLRFKKVFEAIREMRGGELNDPRFGARMRGRGPRFELIDALFTQTCKKVGIDLASDRAVSVKGEESTFRRPSAQLALFPSADDALQPNGFRK